MKSSLWVDEFHLGQRYGIEGKVLLEKQTPFQKIKVIDSKKYGRGLLLDNCWMATEYHEKNYHECLVQPAMTSAKKINKILIIGGGDGGSAKQCFLHQDIDQIDLVEIDKEVIEVCKKYLSAIGGNAWDNPLLKIHIEDGKKWVSQIPDETYDVIIIDSSDPIGPAKGLFNKEFYTNCRRILKNDGVLAAQSESPYSFFEIHIETVKLLKNVFDFADPIYGSMPIYPSGWWSWTFAAKNAKRYLNPQLNRCHISENCIIWSPRWHKASFSAIPAFLDREFAN